MRAVYEVDTGRILWLVRGNAGTSAPEGCEVIEIPDDGEKPTDIYIVGAGKAQRPVMGLDWLYDPQVGEVTVDRIPKGALVTTPNWEGTVHDGFIAWPVTEPGRYPITVECFPYQPETINAEIT